jgi:hypothetical protein
MLTVELTRRWIGVACDQAPPIPEGLADLGGVGPLGAGGMAPFSSRPWVWIDLSNMEAPFVGK